MKNSLLTLIVCLVGIGWSSAQTTITTNHTNNNGNGSVTFNVQNTNGYDIIITGVTCHLNTTTTNNIELLYHNPAISYAGAWGGGTVGAGQNGWISAGTGTVSNSNTANGIVPVLSGISLTIPAGATYTLGLSATSMQYMTLPAGVNTFSGGGVNLITGDNVSWGGTAYPSTPANYPRGLIGGITFIPAVPCTAPPTAGSAAASINPVCPTVNTNISLTGGSGGTGTTYQWQSSTDGVTYTNIPGATSSNYITSQTTATYYQAIVTCSGMSSTSAPVQVNMNAFMDCYCTSIPTNNVDEEIYSVTVNGGSTNPLYAGANGCTTPAPGPGSLLDRYSNFKTLPAITTVATGQTVNFSFTQDECNGATYYGNGVSIWIDFNQNGSFSDAGEQVFVEATTTIGPRTVNGTFTVPGGATPGNTVMRIICAEGLAGSSLTPCLTYGYGETEDHLITIACPTLTGPTGLDVGVCTGSTATVTATPTNGLATISWWNAPAAGTQLATTNSYTTPVLVANTSYYAQEDYPGCPSSPREQFNVVVTSVNVTLAPVNASCNGLNNGSFTQTAVQCGTAPFTYSVDGGAFGAIPTNLTAGTHTVIVKDATTATSLAYQVVITEPGVPTALNVSNLSYFNATLEWTAQGDESTWTVEYGPAGFTPGTGTMITNATNPQDITGLSADTDYEFYVAAGCSPTSQFAGPFAFSTDEGFFTFDNSCGPGFTDISGTGTALNLTDDQTTVVTSSFPLSLGGVTSDQITISNNGYITWGGFPGASLYAWNIDLDSEEGNVYYETVNIGGTNYFIVQWDDRPRFSAVTGQLVTFQLLVNETTGEVYYIYDDVVFGGSQSGNDYGLVGTISVNTPAGTTEVSNYDATYLTNNSCAHFYNALCPNPTNLSTIVFQDDAILDWDAGLYGESAWTLIYGLEGFDPLVPGAAIDTFNLTSSDASFGSTLNQLTSYDVYIYSECQADDLTSPGLMVNFTTLPYCANPTAITAATDIDSLEAAWNWSASSPDYPVTSFNIQYGMAGFDLYDGTTVVANGTNNADTVFNAAFLSGGVYEVYIQAVCNDVMNGGTDTSAFSGPITFTMPLTNDEACGAEQLAANGTVYTFNNGGATVGTGEAAIAPPATGAQTTTGWTNSTLNNTTWFSFIAPASGSVRVNNTGTVYNGQAAVYTSTDCADYATYTLIAANDNEIGGASLAPNYTICGLTPGDTYYLMHDGFNGTTGNYSTSITPIVLEAGTADPVTDVCSGGMVDLFTTVSGNNTGGVWSSSIASVNANISGSNFNSTGLAYQVFNLQYRMTDGCAYDSILTQVHVFGPSTAGMDGTITACLNEPIDLLAGLDGTADLGGNWYDPSDVLLPNSQVSASNIPGQFNYDYIAGNGVCPNDTANVVVNVVGTCNFLSVDEAIFTGVSVYPNPSAGIVFISSDATEAFDYVITDAKGRVVSAMNNGVKGAQVTEINLNNVETGIYFIRLTNASAEKTFRVVIQ